MSDVKETKPRSYRIDDETADRLKEISDKIGGNQQEAFAKLIQAYEFQQGKAVLTEKKSDINQFEKYVNALTRMFMGSLEDNQSITETVRTEFDALLKSKDATIQDLQGQITSAKQIKEEATAKAKKFADDNERLYTEIKELDERSTNEIAEMQRAITDKTDLIDVLKASSEKMHETIMSMKEEHEQFITLSSELEALKRTQDQTERTLGDLQRQHDHDAKEHEKAIVELKQHEIDTMERVKEQAQVHEDKALLALERKYQKEIEVLKEQKQAEVDKYQQKYFDLLEEYKAFQSSKVDFDEACEVLQLSEEDIAKYKNLQKK